MARSKAKRAAAWSYLRDVLRADIALLQETTPPDDVRNVVYRAIDPNHPRYRWGSAVVSFREDLTLRARPRIPLADCNMQPPTGDQIPDSHPGATAIADVVNAEGRSLFTAVSLYGQWEMMPNGWSMYSCARVHRMLSDLTGLFARCHRSPLLIAGDLNLTTQVATYNQRDVDTAGGLAAFARIKAWGMTDCIEATRDSRPRLENCSCPSPETCSHVHTFRLQKKADSRPTQLDYAFASPTLTSRIRACEVRQEEAAWEFSDHCPIVVELDV